MHHTLHLAGIALAATCLLAVPALAAPAETTTASKLYDGPGFDYPVLASYKANVRFDIVWCVTHDGWCLVERNGQKGWLRLDGLDTEVAAASDDAGGTPPGGETGDTVVVDRSAPGGGKGTFTKADPPKKASTEIAPAPKTRF